MGIGEGGSVGASGTGGLTGVSFSGSGLEIGGRLSISGRAEGSVGSGAGGVTGGTGGGDVSSFSLGNSGISGNLGAAPDELAGVGEASFSQSIGSDGVGGI